ncbi:zinc ABC transporter ATP-binding protein [Bacillus coahuilensis p1.1.43]|uniref:Zinc ABC transporter ATP-binding protein n=1 Tax=Bacillus coahuilensis p1.1.43 TaxID=1150625 RepID=A0A147K7F6_9BACI|nr:metal ABC transporter ATP-binding protein [Bacillus coahuilensis]KUP06003.1 zinc ABC transporter ATP-binding protein [Bacillus coahuilensis p1.1.43]
MNSVIEIEDLHYRYERETVLKDINISVPEGAFLALVGPNGSGKSTLLKLILGLLRPKQGRIKLFGEPIQQFKAWEKIGYVSQKSNSFNSAFPATVFEVVKSGLTKKTGMFKFIPASKKKDIIQAIASVGMEQYIHRNIGELSGGQQQRVFIARALVSEPKILILDEPTVGVDQHNVQNFYDMLHMLNKEKGITLVLVTHDIGTVTNNVTHVACLNRELHFHGNTDEFEKFNDQEVSSLYGHDVHVLHHEH